MFEVRLTREAEHAYRRVDASTRARLDAVLTRLEQGDLRNPSVRALKGQLEGSFRWRVGGWRVVFSVDRDASVVWVEAISTRGDAYR